MNPCTWLAGGGAGGGGSGSGNGRDGDGNANADGKDGKGDPNDGNKDAKACGQGTNGACTNCGHTVARGDPVDVSTGKVFTFPQTDLFLPGTFNLEVVRSYSSSRRNVDVGLGFGWIHSLAWSIEERRRELILRTGDGRTVELPHLALGEEVRRGAWGLRRGQDYYAVRPGTEFVHYFGPVDPETGLRPLQFITFRGRGQISLQYERGRLARVVDSVGRVILFERTPDGHIAAISVPALNGQSIVFARYSYDSEHNLVATADADGHVTRYAYDDSHRLRRLEYPTGVVFHFVYDNSGRCVETWGAHESGVDPALVADVPASLIDGTRAKGIYHCRFTYDEDGYTEVVDSVRLQRFFSESNGTIEKAVDARGGVTTRLFDDLGRVVEQTDPNDATWRYEYDELDNVVRETNPEGHSVQIERDGGGRELAITDPNGGRMQLDRDDIGELTAIQLQDGSSQQLVLDGRGQIIERHDELGGRHLYEYDLHANLVAYVTPLGSRYETSYDYWGRPTSDRDALGAERRYWFSDSGKLIAKQDGLGRRFDFSYDPLGNLVLENGPDGAYSWEFGGLGWLCGFRQPDGSEVRIAHNREGWPVRIVNELGETHELEYEASGLIRAEKDFHGRVTRYGFDALGNSVWFDEGAGKHFLTRNLLGQTVSEDTPAGETINYRFDPRGELVEAQAGDVMLSWTRNPIGKVVREELRVDGATYTVESEFIPGGHRSKIKSSLGHELGIAKDADGRVAELATSNGRALRIERNALGLATVRHLSQGGAIAERFDAGFRLRERGVLPANAALGAGMPQWVGAHPPGTLQTLFDYSEADELTHVDSWLDGDAELEYDVRRHLKRRARPKSLETFSADAADNYFETGGAARTRTYGQGNQLLRQDNVAYDYNPQGYLLQKRELRADGTTSAVTRYEWNGRGLLQAVEQHDGTRVEFKYDAFARRVAKRVARADVEVEKRHYVWDLVSMLHDVQVDDESKPAGVRTYLFTDNDDETPLAHSDDLARQWVYYVQDVNGAPDLLVDGGGRPLGKLDRQAFGKTVSRAGSSATTSIRFPGQQEDPETGLHYNRYRYFDPDIGRYISPDPIGLEGGLNLYSYGPNPVSWIDPMGWAKHRMKAEGAGDDDSWAKNQYYKDTKVSGVGYRSGWGKKGGPCPPELQTIDKCHTEQKFSHDLISTFGPGGKRKGKLKGKNVKLNGKFPPCPNCHAALMRAAQQTGANVEYNWVGTDGKPQAITYKGGSGQPSATTGTQSQGLTDAYKNVQLNDDKKWKLQKGAEHKDTKPEEYWGFKKDQGATDAYNKLMNSGYRDK